MNSSHRQESFGLVVNVVDSHVRLVTTTVRVKIPSRTKFFCSMFPSNLASFGKKRLYITWKRYVFCFQTIFGNLLWIFVLFLLRFQIGTKIHFRMIFRNWANFWRLKIYFASFAKFVAIFTTASFFQANIDKVNASKRIQENFCEKNPNLVFKNSLFFLYFWQCCLFWLRINLFNYAYSLIQFKTLSSDKLFQIWKVFSKNGFLSVCKSPKYS